MGLIAIVLLYWGVMFFVCGGFFCVFGYWFLRKGMKYSKMKEEMIKEVEEDLKAKYNRIATLDTDKLFKFLANSYSRSLEIQAKIHSSDKDPNALETLYTRSLADLLTYLGPSIVEGIDFYYGKEFLDRWTMQSYQLLNERGYIEQLVRADVGITAERIESVMAKADEM